MNGWRLNNCAIVFIAAPVEQVWRALTDPDMSEKYFMGARVEVGEEGGRYAVTRDKPDVTGKVLVKEAPHRLRVTWEAPAPPNITLPNCELNSWSSRPRPTVARWPSSPSANSSTARCRRGSWSPGAPAGA